MREPADGATPGDVPLEEVRCRRLGPENECRPARQRLPRHRQVALGDLVHETRDPISGPARRCPAERPRAPARPPTSTPRPPFATCPRVPSTRRAKGCTQRESSAGQFAADPGRLSPARPPIPTAQAAPRVRRPRPRSPAARSAARSPGCSPEAPTENRPRRTAVRVRPQPRRAMPGAGRLVQAHERT